MTFQPAYSSSGSRWLKLIPAAQGARQEPTLDRTTLPSHGVLTRTPTLTQAGTVETRQFTSHAHPWDVGRNRSPQRILHTDSGPGRKSIFLLINVITKQHWTKRRYSKTCCACMILYNAHVILLDRHCSLGLANTIFPILWMRKLKIRKVKWVFPDLTASKQYCSFYFIFLLTRWGKFQLERETEAETKPYSIDSSQGPMLPLL